MNIRILLFSLLIGLPFAMRAERVDMRAAGAKANGTTLNTRLINQTIDRLSKGGGGTLFFLRGATSQVLS
ncbi:polygalacturonase [Bacteroides graminisolvens DSM 19988 = JCM 15093]|uniref:Polygalacturonase n=1 Tax=Bacteroides graminisolvens DSM 19988 = JCM 15093 TaxID=1121097 RepID=A0A069D057_9BACE|nr:polygalacturonase [Bacteroides graminisolvens DSM 19988 = JCM 15093]